MLYKIENELFRYLDSLRKRKKLTQEELSFGIIDPRLYRKYLTGDVKAPIEIIALLVDKLGIRFENFMREFSKKQSNESDIVTQLLSHVINYDFQMANNILTVLEPDSILQKENQIVYDLSLLLIDFFSGKLKQDDLVCEVKELIDYQNLIKKDSLSLIESYSLGTLLSYANDYDKKISADKLESVLLKPELIVYGENIKILNLTMLQLIKYYDSKKEFSRAKALIESGIDNCIRTTSFYLLDYFYFCLASCEKSLGNMDGFKENVFKCYCCVNSTQGKAEKEKFYKLLEQECNGSIESYIKRCL